MLRSIPLELRTGKAESRRHLAPKVRVHRNADLEEPFICLGAGLHEWIASSIRAMSKIRFTTKLRASVSADTQLPKNCHHRMALLQGFPCHPCQCSS
jgi:hypothetical protein